MEQQGVDFFSLPRRQLQALCKQYKIPANTTNVAMATALDNLLNKENGREVNVAELLTPHKAPDSVGRLTRSQAKKQESAKRTDTLAGRELFVEERSARKPPTRNKEEKQVRKPRTCKTTPRALQCDPEVVVHEDDSAALSKEVSSGTCSSGLSSINVADTVHDTSVESIRKDGVGDGNAADAPEQLAELDEEVLEEAKQVSLDPALAIEVEQLSQALSCVIKTSDAPVNKVMDAELDSALVVGNVEALEDEMVQKDAEELTEGVNPESQRGCDAAFGTPVEDEVDQCDRVDSESGKDQSSSMEPENASAKPKERSNKRRTGKENTPLMVQRLQLRKIRKGKLNNQRKKETRAAEEMESYSENGESRDKSVLCVLKDEALEDNKVQENAEELTKPSDGVKQHGETASIIEADEESSDKSILYVLSASTADNVDALEDSKVQENAEELTKHSDGVKQHGETASIVEADEDSSDKSILYVLSASIADNIDALEDSKVQENAEEVTKLSDGVKCEAVHGETAFGAWVVEPAEGGEVNQCVDSESVEDHDSSRASMEPENGSAKPQKKHNKKQPTGKENMPFMFETLSLRQLRKIHKEKIENQRKKEVGTSEPMQSAAHEMQKNQKGSVSLLRKTTPLSPNSEKKNRAH